MKRKAAFRKSSRRRVLAHGQGASKPKRDHTRTSPSHRRALRMRGRRNA